MFLCVVGCGLRFTVEFANKPQKKKILHNFKDAEKATSYTLTTNLITRRANLVASVSARVNFFEN